VPDRPLVSRRSALAGALGSAALSVLAAGCDHGDDIGDSPASSSPSPRGSASASASSQTPDEALVAQVLGQLTGAFGVLVTARKLAPLRPVVAPLVRAHRRHVAVLDGDVSGWVAPVIADPAEGLHAVRRSEQRLQVALADAAAKAESGALARLLASMSASVTQYLAALPTEIGT
jgi:hypothetical protein